MFWYVAFNVYLQCIFQLIVVCVVIHMVFSVFIILQDILLTRAHVVCIENKVALCGRNSMFTLKKQATWVTIYHIVWDDRCLIRVRRSIRHYIFR